MGTEGESQPRQQTDIPQARDVVDVPAGRDGPARGRSSLRATKSVVSQGRRQPREGDRAAVVEVGTASSTEIPEQRRPMEKPLRFSPRQRDSLVLQARGLSATEIAEALELPSEDAAKTHLSVVRKKLGTHSAEETILKAMSLGILVPEDILLGFDEKKITALTAAERSVLDRLIAHNGSRSQNKQIAKDLSVDEETVRTHLAHAYEKLGTTNRAHTVAIYGAFRLLHGGSMPLSERRQRETSREPRKRHYTKISSEIMRLRGDQSQIEFARRFSLSRGAITHIEQGDVPSVQAIAIICDGLGLPRQEKDRLFLIAARDRIAIKAVEEPLPDLIRVPPVLLERYAEAVDPATDLTQEMIRKMARTGNISIQELIIRSHMHLLSFNLSMRRERIPSPFIIASLARALGIPDGHPLLDSLLLRAEYQRLDKGVRGGRLLRRF